MATYEVLPFSEEHLFASLANRLLGPAAVAAHGRAKYLSRYLRDVNARSIVVEHDYTDGDYLDDFATYYVKCFHDYPRRCKRLHFFANDLTADEFLKLVRGDLPDTPEQTLRDSYLGFVVARPLPDAIIGRTILKTYDSENDRRHYPCTREYTANLFGMDLSVGSLPFQEQDSVLAACATVALWCAFHKTAGLFGTPTPTPAMITRVANQVVHPARPVPSHGLNIQQICNSIRNVGLEPEVIQVSKNVPLVSLIYGHLRMGLPVLLLVDVEGRGLHAITLTGYSLRNQQALVTEVASGERSLPLTGLRIDEFYGHDDQIGPFARIYIKPSATVEKTVYPVTFDGSWFDSATGTHLTLYPKVVIVPVYHKIRVTFLDIHQWLTRLNSLLQSLTTPDGKALKLEWDLHLITTNEYKKLLRESALAKDQVERLLLLQQPRFIWRALLRIDGVIALELHSDATDMARSFPVYEAVWHDASFRSGFALLLNEPALADVLKEILTERFYEFLRGSTAP